MGDALVVYECTLCHTYLDNCTSANLHLETKHSAEAGFAGLQTTNTKSKGSRLRRAKKKEVENLIKPTKFLAPTVSLERLSPDEIIEHSSRSPTTKEPRTKRRVPQGQGRLEIKLDTLKAGEMETLISGLFQAASNPEESNFVPIRKSGRKVKERLKRNYGELDSEDEEIIRTGTSSTTLRNKTKNVEDDAYRPHKHFGSTRKETPGREDKPTRTMCCVICDPDKSNPMIQTAYQLHMEENHLKNNKYTCPHCEKGYFPIKSISQHMKRVHSSSKSKRSEKKYTKNIKCKLCGKILLSVVAFDIHMKNHEKQKVDVKAEKCPICPQSFLYKYSLQKHFILHLENNPFKCKFLQCGKAFGCQYNLKKHIALHTDRVVFKCDKCKAEFSRKERLDVHVTNYHSKDSKNIFTPLRRVKYQVKSIHDLVPQLTATVKAPAGDEDEGLRFELESIHLADQIVKTEEGQKDVHIKGEVLSPQKRRFEPEVRHPNFRSGSSSRSGSDDEENGDSQLEVSEDAKLSEMDLRKIIMSDPVVVKLQKDTPGIIDRIFPIKTNTHYGRDDFKCKICPWTTTMAYSLNRHMKQAHGDTSSHQLPSSQPTPDNPLGTSLTCGSCGYQSTSTDDLASHISETHIKDNKFFCSICGMRFSTESKKDSHVLRVHRNDKPFSCSKCDQKYSKRGSLKKHFSNKHDPTYRKILKETCKCGICGRILMTQSGYGQHMKLHADDRQLHPCKICGQTCASIYTLRRHIQYVHMGAKNSYKELQKLKRLEAKKSRLRATVSTSSDQPKAAGTLGAEAVEGEHVPLVTWPDEEDADNVGLNSEQTSSHLNAIQNSVSSQSESPCNEKGSAEILGF